MTTYDELYNKLWHKLNDPDFDHNCYNSYVLREDLAPLAMAMIPDMTMKEFETIYAKAWEDGHADGYHAVMICFNDLLFFVKSLFEYRKRVSQNDR